MMNVIEFLKLGAKMQSKHDIWEQNVQSLTSDEIAEIPENLGY
jgi:hypothetical protein